MGERKNVLFIAKTNLNNDGRILNQIKILQDHFNENLEIDFILLPDKPLEVSLGDNVNIYNINTSFRNSSIMRFLTVFEFTWKVLKLLFKIDPPMIHVQDMAVVLPVYLYRLIRGTNFKLIYDDHELPNENEPLQYRFFNFSK